MRLFTAVATGPVQKITRYYDARWKESDRSPARFVGGQKGRFPVVPAGV